MPRPDRLGASPGFCDDPGDTVAADLLGDVPVSNLREVRALSVFGGVGLRWAARNFVEAFDKGAEFVFGVGVRHNLLLCFAVGFLFCSVVAARCRPPLKRQASGSPFASIPWAASWL